MADSRYIRQTLLKEIGETGQQKLSQASIVIVGCGGLGSIAAPYLAGAGVGKIILVDGDLPQVSNLHRQVMLADSSTSKTKAEVLKEKLLDLNPEIEVTAIPEMLSKENVEEYLGGCDLVLECTDAIWIKYLVNDYCHLQNIPMVYGAIHKYEGYLSFFKNGGDEDIHLRDIFPVPNEDIPSCSEVGVLGTIAGLIGMLQANEVIKYFTGIGKLLQGRLLTYDVLNNEQLVLRLKKNYKEDLSSVFESTHYQLSVSCATSEINWDDVEENRADYHLISVLEKGEHRALDKEVIHLPLSSTDLDYFVQQLSGPTVYYCRTGLRSSGLVAELEKRKLDFPVYSLKGGFRATK